MTEPSGHGSWEMRADPPSLLEGVASVAYRAALFALAVGGAVIKCARGRRSALESRH